MRCFSIVDGEVERGFLPDPYPHVAGIPNGKLLKTASFQLSLELSWNMDAFVAAIKNRTAEDVLLYGHVKLNPQDSVTSLLPETTFLLETIATKQPRTKHLGDASIPLLFKGALLLLVCPVDETVIWVGDGCYLINEKGKPLIVDDISHILKKRQIDNEQFEELDTYNVLEF